MSCYVMLAIFLIFIWSTRGNGLVIVKSAPSNECTLAHTLGTVNHGVRFITTDIITVCAIRTEMWPVVCTGM